MKFAPKEISVLLEGGPMDGLQTKFQVDVWEVYFGTHRRRDAFLDHYSRTFSRDLVSDGIIFRYAGHESYPASILQRVHCFFVRRGFFNPRVVHDIGTGCPAGAPGAIGSPGLSCPGAVGEATDY